MLTLDDSLAMCELYYGIVVLVLRVYPRMELVETTIDDVKLYRDLFVPIIKDGRKGVQVLITDEVVDSLGISFAIGQQKAPTEDPGIGVLYSSSV